LRKALIWEEQLENSKLKLKYSSMLSFSSEILILSNLVREMKKKQTLCLLKVKHVYMYKLTMFFPKNQKRRIVISN